jgi:hypothetical protein
MRKTTLAALCATALLGFAAPQPTSAAGGPELTRSYPGESYAQYYYRRGYYYDPGAAAAAGIAGLAAGAIIGGAIANQPGSAAQPLPQTQNPEFIAYCSRKYRSFDPYSGTYMARDGNRYMCEYP